MELVGAVRLSFRISLCLLLVPGLVTMKESISAIVDKPILLNIPNCNLLETDDLQWKKSQTSQLAKRKKSVVDNIKDCGCALQANGSLLLQKAESSTYSVLVHDNSGKSKCTEEITVITQVPVDTPSIEYNCTEKSVAIRCSISEGTAPKLTISLNNQVKNPIDGKSISINIKEKTGTVLCIASNSVSNEQQNKEFNCTEVWNIYLILSIAGGGVAFLIFLVLVIYLVKQRPCRHDNRAEEDVRLSYERTPQNMQQRPLPEPYLQPTDAPEFSSNQKPLTPHRQQNPSKPTVKKGKQSQQRRPRPQEPTEKGPQHHEMPTLQPTKPALPANHPNEQPPRPQPRTKSKAPRQHRKNP
ncbi:T-cell surface antigen CD2 [Mixophyes fleayi]|uniref:T-cell surface antigen CD2 n=1 Tax=Mixophyes fleayi TaxID=3061075 RepID=UPI003F4D7EEA